MVGRNLEDPIRHHGGPSPLGFSHQKRRLHWRSILAPSVSSREEQQSNTDHFIPNPAMAYCTCYCSRPGVIQLVSSHCPASNGELSEPVYSACHVRYH